ncbi:PTS system cellobiose-specific IIA component [Natronobacillus azotifigens]|uniref:PTS lactose/cellobiose transporter subunit IIA n=1 Tax=Natronobacillus azotifigens TaxID=472978 RepID=A0A9J6R833_9BACI|nr:PTS lactose/cellobiose transporter subunit IIA [Natronobacillus azotifigens]MCZ0701711.1 PTS lactose/cellobiose transporter subunit IIA [Natronobacillus azotifigens]
MNTKEIINGIIASGGSARDHAMRAITAAKSADFEEANKWIKKSNQSLHEGHKLQSQLMEVEENGQLSEITLLMIHAQDHIMTASSLKDLAVEIIYLHKEK